MASSKRKQDEKHLKMLREMAALPANKQCFDCHQRGPTYVNMTIGSFVCTSCSGILRGLNPPHRVKSISMASFTPEEMEFLKCHGNDLCRKVYLGLYDSRSGAEPDSRDEQKVKDFMVQKYERKRYYVAPTDTMKAEAKQANEAVMNKQPATKPLKTLLGEKTPSLQVQQNDQNDVEVEPEETESPKQTLKSQAAAVPGQITLGHPPQQRDASFQSPGQQSISSQSSGSATMDLLGDLGGDPFSSSSSTPSNPPAGGDTGGFANFDSFNQFGSQPKPAQSATQSAFPGFQTSSNPLVPMGNTPSGPTPIVNGSSSQNVAAPSGGDKYSALSDLFSSSPSSSATGPASSSVNWAGGSSELNWGGTSSSTISTGGGGVNWNSSSQGVNWNSTSTASSGVDWMSSSNSNTSNALSNAGYFGNHIPAGKPGNPFFTDYGGTANPFGGTSASTATSVSNPFGGGQQGGFGQAHAPPSNQMAGFGQQPAGFGPSGGFGQSPGFGQPVSSAAGFGQQPAFGQAVSSSGGFGQQAGFGQPVSSSMGFGQQPGFGQPANSSAGFGQPASSNAGFGQPANSNAGFGQPANSNAGFGQQSFGQNAMGGFNQPPASSAGFGGQGGWGGAQPQGFGQFPMQNGAFSSAGGFGGQSMAQGGNTMTTPTGQSNKMVGQQGGFPPGWGQSTPSANPFMSAATSQHMAPKTNSTNPFL